MKVALISDTHYGMDGKTHTKHMKFWKRLAKEIKKEDVKVLIWAGDMASFRQRHLRRSLEMANEFITIPIVAVRGNHDFWDGADHQDRNAGNRSLDEIFRLHEWWFSQNHIHLLGNEPIVIEDVIICGFDGWYGSSNPNTNDKHWMPKTIQGEQIVMQYMAAKAWKDFQKCLDIDTSGYRKSIIVTHHNVYPFSPYKGFEPRPTDEILADGITYSDHSGNYRFLPEIREKFDVLCCGHTHGYRNDTKEGIQIYNCGSDYNKPQWLIFDI